MCPKLVGLDSNLSPSSQALEGHMVGGMGMRMDGCSIGASLHCGDNRWAVLIQCISNRHSLLISSVVSGGVSFLCVSCAQLILFCYTEVVKTNNKQNRKTKQRTKTITELATCLNRKHPRTYLCWGRGESQVLTKQELCRRM